MSQGFFCKDSLSVFDAIEEELTGLLELLPWEMNFTMREWMIQMIKKRTRTSALISLHSRWSSSILPNSWWEGGLGAGEEGVQARCPPSPALMTTRCFPVVQTAAIAQMFNLRFWRNDVETTLRRFQIAMKCWPSLLSGYKFLIAWKHVFFRCGKFTKFHNVSSVPVAQLVELTQKRKFCCIIYLLSWDFKGVWLSFFCRSKKKVFWRMLANKQWRYALTCTGFVYTIEVNWCHDCSVNNEDFLKKMATQLLFC